MLYLHRFKTLSSLTHSSPIFRLIGSFLEQSAEYCWVLEDSAGVCGYVLCALDHDAHARRTQNAWIPHLMEKYPKPAHTDNLTPAEVSVLVRSSE